MGSILDKLNGWKTYIAGVAAILTAIVAYLNHAITLGELIATITASVGTMTVRHGVTTTVSDATGKKL